MIFPEITADEMPFARLAQPSARGGPAWEIALTFPPQGTWEESEYLGISTNRMVEFDNGAIEVLPMPTYWHQLIVDFLHDRLREYVKARRLGKVLCAPLPIRLFPKKYREPDLVFLSTARAKTVVTVPIGADLVMEVVSEGADARRRDLETKRAEYAAAGIPEYWIVDPELKEITVLALDGAEYRVHGVFRNDAFATSLLLDGFSVKAADVFAAGEPETKD